LRQCHIWDGHNRNDIVTVSKVQDRARSGSRRMSLAKCIQRAMNQDLEAGA
jgi:hypothetical protein